MKRQKQTISLILLAAAFAFTSCKNPLLSVGLGDKVDILPPGISIVPTAGVQNGAYVRGTVTVHGEVSDDVGVESVTWMFSDEATGDPSPVGTATVAADGESWSFVLDTQNPAWGATLRADGEKSFVITVTDGSGKSTETRMLLIFDNTAPSGTFISPDNGASVYSKVLLRGANSDNTSLIRVEVRIGKTIAADADTGFELITGSKYDWTRLFFSNDYANTDFAADNGDGTWTLPIYLRVYDYAGNVSTNEPSNPADPLYPDDLVAVYGSAVSFDPLKIPDFHLIVDLDRDKPEASIQTPLNASNVAGTVIASGSCFDESPGMKWVNLRIMALEDDDTEIGYVRPDGTAIAAPGWVNITPTGGAYWQANLNEGENLYNVCAPTGAYPGAGTHNGRLRLQVQPVDDNDKLGNIQTVTFRLDQSIPRLENPQITLDDGATWNLAHDYLYVSGTIRLRARVSDDVSVASIKLSLDGGSTYGANLIGTYTTPDGPSAYWLDVEINTLTDTQIPVAIRGAGKSGLLGMAVKVQDAATPAPYVNTWLVTLNLDNSYPSVTYTGTSGNGHDPMDLHGTVGASTSQVMGTTTDSGTVSGIDRVEVYFVKGANVINLTNGSLESKVQAPFGASQTLRDYTTNADCKFVIDWTKVGAVDNMQLTQNGADVDWWAKIEAKLASGSLPDGSVDINYVAWDNAGNAEHGMHAGFIRNHVPVISSVTVGTDLNGDTDLLDLNEKTTYNPASPITARNDTLYIKINTSTVGMNTPFSYSIKNTTPGEVTELSDATGTATIDISGGRFGGDGTGKVFTVKITDAVGIVVQQTVTVNIDNVDGENPTITVNPIAAPADLLDWTASPVAGHIEEIALSTYDNGGTADADVSGTVMVRGSAHDNVRIDLVTLSIDGGAPFTVAHWNGMTLVSDIPASFNISTETLTDSGHDVTWDYKWNTAGIATVAKNNTVLAFVATDKSTNNSVNAARTRQYDVVPYITQVDTAITGLLSKDFARSAKGVYPVQTGEVITVKGYNLGPTTTGVGGGNSDVRLVSLANRDSVAKSAGLGSRGLVYAGVGSPYTSFTATISTPAADGSIGSGYLVVWANGVPSLNARSGRSNAETNFVATTGTDERWLSVWNLTRLKDSVAGAQYGLYPSMAMNGDTPVFAYVNNSAGYGQAKYWNGATEKSIFNNWDLFTFSAISVNASGNHGVLFDINVVNGNFGDYNSGNSGGILTSFYYDVPAHAWNNCYDFKSYHVWLDNLVDTRHRHVGTVDRSAGFNWSVTNQTLEVTTTAGSSTVTLNANCANLAAIVAHINTRLAVGTNHANYIEAYDGGSGRVGMRIKGNPTGGGDQSYTLGAGGTAMATLGFTAGTYPGVAAILDRYRFPDLVLRGTSALSTAYYSVYDALEDKVIARAYKVGTDNLQVVGNQINSGGSNLYTNIGQYNGNGTFPTYDQGGGTPWAWPTGSRFYNNTASNPAGRSPDGGYTVATGAGPWTAAAATSGGVMLVVWYDTGSNQLKYAYNTTPSATGGGSFGGTKTLDTFCGGDYVDMIVDGSDQVHIAYHDSFSGDLKYVFFPTYNGTAQGPYTVDSYLTVGNKAGLSVSSAGIPYITYKGMGNTAKTAWLVGARGNGVDGNGKFTGPWEVQVLPRAIVDTDSNRFSMGINLSTLPVVGYTNSGTGIEYVRKLADLP